MKRCPQCHRVETDNSLVFCRSDGAPLVSNSLPGSEAEAARLDSDSTEAHTSILPHPTAANVSRTTGPTTILQPPVTSTGTRELTKPKRRLFAIALAILLAAAICLGGYSFFSRHRTEAVESIAVLPFQNKSLNADAEYLSDGLTESLIYRLSQLPSLKVSPTSSVFRYKGKDTDAVKVGSELDVQAVMSGRMVQRGDSLTISVELVNTRNNKLIWGEQYERKMSDLLATQRDIAAEIANKLQLKLSGDGEVKLAKTYTNNNEAYQLYLKGRFYWNKRDEENFKKAIEQFKAAADKDPNFALAFVGLSDCYSLLPEYGHSTLSNEALPQAKIYAERALQIDPSLGEAHISLANYYSLTWNWNEADREFKKGIELSPNYATGHKWYGLQLVTLGRFDEALAELKRAQALEPLSGSINLNVADGYSAKGDFNAAVEQCQKTIDLDPNWYYPHAFLSLGYLEQGRKAEALVESEKSVEQSKRHSIPLGVLGYIYAKTGNRNEAVAITEELKQRYGKRQANGYDLARVFVGLEEKDQAFAWLEKDFESRNQLLPFWLMVPPLNSLRDDPRARSLMTRMNIPLLN